MDSCPLGKVGFLIFSSFSVFLREYILVLGQPSVLLHLSCPPQYNEMKKWLEVDIGPDLRGRIPLLLTSLSFKVSVWREDSRVYTGYMGP